MLIEIAVIALCVIVAAMGFMCSVLARRVKKLEAQVSIVNKVVERTIWGGR